MVDQGISISLSGKDCLIAVPFVFGNQKIFVPCVQHVQSVSGVLLRSSVDLAGITQQEVQGGSSNSSFTSIGFKLVRLALSAIRTDRFVEVGKVEVRRVATETIAAGFASK